MVSTDKVQSESGRQDLKQNALEVLLGFQLRRAQVKLFQHFKTSMSDLAITPGQAGVLILIENNPGISQAALARVLGIERATLGETIDGLQEKRWVNRRKSPNDGRSHALHLSQRGEDMMKKLHPAIERHEKEISGKLNKNDYAELMRLLAKFNNE